MSGWWAGSSMYANTSSIEVEGGDRLAAEGFPPESREFERALDVRYAGQAYDLTVEAPGEIDASGLDRVARRFHERHEARYGHASPGEPLELVAVRLRARGAIDPPDLRVEGASASLADARREAREVRFDDEWIETPVYERGALPTGTTFEGPAIVEGSESTVVVPPGSSGERDEHGTLLLEVDG